MLQTQTVEPSTFAVLKQLMQLPALEEFWLAGGTALSLKYGHRISIDLDFFSPRPFDREVIIRLLEKVYNEDFTYDGAGPNWAIFCFVRDIKVDFVHHPHPFIVPPETIEGIRLYSTEDIIAMKVNAILGRAQKKDFWDICELLKHYTLAQLIHFHKTKFPSQQLLITIPKALTYFEEADQSPDPISLKGQTWDEVKAFIQNKVSEFLS